MKKTLLVIGSYPSTEAGEKILQDTITRVRDDFDILLGAHCPVSKEIQNAVQYFIYDYRNDIIPQNKDAHFWADYPDFYFKIYAPENSLNHSYAVLRLLMNACYLADDYYEDFVYIEGDCLFSKEDILKLKEFKTTCANNNKDALFFKFPEFLSTLIFYTKIKFFKKAFYFAKTPEDYQAYANYLGSYGSLENYLYKNLENKNLFEQVQTIDYKDLADYFNTSKLSVNAYVDGKIVYNRSYFIRVVRLEGTDKLAMCYMTNENKQFESPMNVYLEGEKITTLPTGKFATVIPINPTTDIFSIKFEDGTEHRYSKQLILSPKNNSFAKIK